MTCFNGEYFIGNGSLYLRTKESGCSGAYTGGYVAVGDISDFTLSVDHDITEHYESTSGNRTRALYVPVGTSVTGEAMLKTFSLTNLLRTYWGYDAGAVAGGSVVGEEVTGYVGTMAPLAYPEVSAVTVYDVSSGSPGALMTVTTDYTIDTRNGTITLVDSGNWTNSGSTPNSLEVSYTHGGTQGAVEAFVTNSPEVGARFEAINLAQPDVAWIVEIWRWKLLSSETLSLIGTEPNDISLRGAILPNANTGNTSAFFKITQSTVI